MEWGIQKGLTEKSIFYSKNESLLYDMGFNFLDSTFQNRNFLFLIRINCRVRILIHIESEKLRN